jgi:DNA polymerase-3 subunit delta
VVRRVEAMRGAVEAAVEAAVSDERRDGRLVLVGGALDRRKRWYAAARTRAHEIACVPLTDEGDVRGWVECLARERGVRLGGDAVAALLERCGFDLALLDGEIERVALRAGTATVGRDVVQEVVAQARGHAVEALTDRLGRGDVTGAIRVLRGLFDDDEPPLRVLGFLAANVRRALHVAEEQERGVTLPEIAARLGMPEWLVRRQLGRGSAAHLERALDTLLELDLALKRSRPEEIVFEAALDRLAAPRRGRATP